MKIAYQGNLEGRNCKEIPAVSVIEVCQEGKWFKLQEISWKSQNRKSWRRFVMDITRSIQQNLFILTQYNQSQYNPASL